MKRLLYWGSLMLLIVFSFAACSEDELEGLTPVYPEAEQKATAVPFTATYTTYPEFMGMDENGVETYEITANGSASLLGKSTWYSVTTVNTGFKPLPPPWDQVGKMEFKVRGGDKLIGHFEGDAYANPPEVPFYGDGKFVITGGTGQFKGYTGYGTYSFALSPEFVGRLEFTGTVNFSPYMVKK